MCYYTLKYFRHVRLSPPSAVWQNIRYTRWMVFVKALLVCVLRLVSRWDCIAYRAYVAVLKTIGCLFTEYWRSAYVADKHTLTLPCAWCANKRIPIFLQRHRHQHARRIACTLSGIVTTQLGMALNTRTLCTMSSRRRLHINSFACFFTWYGSVTGISIGIGEWCVSRSMPGHHEIYIVICPLTYSSSELSYYCCCRHFFWQATDYRCWGVFLACFGGKEFSFVGLVHISKSVIPSPRAEWGQSTGSWHVSSHWLLKWFSFFKVLSVLSPSTGWKQFLDQIKPNNKHKSATGSTVTEWIRLLVGRLWVETVQNQMQTALRSDMTKGDEIVGKQQLLKTTKASPISSEVYCFLVVVHVLRLVSSVNSKVNFCNLLIYLVFKLSICKYYSY